MYSGTTLRQMRHFDAWFGAHQKIDRTARNHLKALLNQNQSFPATRQILRFEGMDGPDGIKRKTPGKDEPWHYIDPEDASDRDILKLLEGNFKELVKALKAGNQTRAAFEAAWLAHGIVDGMTPAHHYPYEDELVRLRGAGIDTRTTAKDKIMVPGDTIPERVSKNWQVWGDKGLIATHFAFEWGIAVMITPLRLSRARPTETELAHAVQLGLSALFLERAQAVKSLGMYEQFYKSGWTPKLAKQARIELVPTIINTVTLAWYLAARKARID